MKILKTAEKQLARQNQCDIDYMAISIHGDPGVAESEGDNIEIHINNNCAGDAGCIGFLRGGFQTTELVPNANLAGLIADGLQIEIKLHPTGPDAVYIKEVISNTYYTGDCDTLTRSLTNFWLDGDATDCTPAENGDTGDFTAKYITFIDGELGKSNCCDLPNVPPYQPTFCPVQRCESDLPEIEHGNLTCSQDSNYDSVCGFDCDEGYSLQSNYGQIMCSLEGDQLEWVSVGPMIEDVENVVITSTNFANCTRNGPTDPPISISTEAIIGAAVGGVFCLAMLILGIFIARRTPAENKKSIEKAKKNAKAAKNKIDKKMQQVVEKAKGENTQNKKKAEKSKKEDEKPSTKQETSTKKKKKNEK